MKIEPGVLRNWILLGITILTLLGGVYGSWFTLNRDVADLEKDIAAQQQIAEDAIAEGEERGRHNYGTIEEIHKSINDLDKRLIVIEVTR